VRILPGAAVILGDTPEEVRERAEWVHEEQISPPRAIVLRHLEALTATDSAAPSGSPPPSVLHAAPR
jgi:hypothetical protein